MVLASVISSVVVVVLVLLMAASRMPKACPSCQAALPRLRAPKTWHQALWGSVTCPACNVELDRVGQKVMD